METNCVRRRKNTDNKNFSVRQTKQNRLMLLSDCVSKKKSKTNKLLDYNPIELCSNIQQLFYFNKI